MAGSLLLSSGLGSDLGLGLWAVRNIRPLVWGEVGEIKILEWRFYRRRKTLGWVLSSVKVSSKLPVKVFIAAMT